MLPVHCADITAPPQANDARDATGNLRWLYAGRAIRSFATAFLTVIFPLYLAARHEPATTVGLVLTLGSVIGAGMVAAVGVVGDRFGRRPVLIGLGVLGALGALALVLSENLAVVVVASGLSGIGRGGGAGSGGAFGPFFPAEQPLLAGSTPAATRTRTFGRRGFIGVIAAAAGSLAAGAPAVLHRAGISWISAYELMFLAAAVISVAVALVSVPIREPRPLRDGATAPPSDAHGAPGEPSEATRRATGGDGGRGGTPATPAGLTTRQLIRRLGFANALNGFGFGFLGPLLTYWFFVRFGVGPAEVGVLYTIVNLAGAIPYLGAHRLSDRLGAVRAVVVARIASIVMLAAMALVSGFLLAGLFLTLRTACNSLALPARLSYAMGAADERRRGLVAAMGSLPSMLTSSVSPVVGGAIMASFVDVPIVGAVFFMTANVIAYYLSFRNAPLPGERAPRPG